MKGIISKVPVSIAGRAGSRTGIVFVTITIDERNASAGRRKLTVSDYEVVQNENPQPGERLVNYIKLEDNPRIRTRAEIDQVFALLQRDILHTQSLEEQLDDLYADFILLDTQQNPIRDSQPQDWEKHTMNEEVVPGEPDPEPIPEV